MTDDPFGGPGSSSGIDWESLKGKLLLITPHAVEQVQTSFGEKDCVRADVAVVDAAAGEEQEHKDTLIFPRVLIGQVRGYIGTGRMALGRLGQGNAKPGQKPPWRLDDPSDDDKTAARAYLAANAPVPF